MIDDLDKAGYGWAVGLLNRDSGLRRMLCNRSIVIEHGIEEKQL